MISLGDPFVLGAGLLALLSLAVPEAVRRRGEPKGLCSRCGARPWRR